MIEVYQEPDNAQFSRYGMEYFINHSRRKQICTSHHIHSALELLYFTEGEFSVVIDNREVTAKPGDFVFVRSNMIHAIEGQGTYGVLKIYPSLLYACFPADTVRFAAAFLRTTADLQNYYPAAACPDAIKEAFRRLGELDQSPLRYPAARIIAGEALIRLADTPYVAPADTGGFGLTGAAVEAVDKAIRLIDQGYAEPLPAARVADTVHLSYSHFAKLFRAVTGKTFKEYLTGVRLSHAENELLFGHASITEIAETCGFSSASYFIAEYHRVKGRTPLETRKAAAEKAKQKAET